MTPHVIEVLKLWVIILSPFVVMTLIMHFQIRKANKPKKIEQDTISKQLEENEQMLFM